MVEKTIVIQCIFFFFRSLSSNGAVSTKGKKSMQKEREKGSQKHRYRLLPKQPAAAYGVSIKKNNILFSFFLCQYEFVKEFFFLLCKPSKSQSLAIFIICVFSLPPIVITLLPKNRTNALDCTILENYKYYQKNERSVFFCIKILPDDVEKKTIDVLSDNGKVKFLNAKEIPR